ncbi:hypothetical protein CCO03_12380 [Comamonas serinivorans]|uniref:DUF2004 domain-containing protein n=1 Tax=Comamonas serinivorans TaxID=1082851 RepID=A0A1Y0EPH2_9BURK|nr:DUF2004 domain-containing protein [Comamonas serinivorans]ARU05378.1 hypothetical protein CCO03_12380 [Comamonas serinivorans]
MNHPHFGELDTSSIEGRDVVWERDLVLEGQAVDVALWADAGQVLDPGMLDAFASLLQDLAGVDARARVHLLAELEADDDFITYHTDEGENFPGLAAIAPDGAITPAAFVQAMRLTHASLWADGLVVLDYQMDPEHSDQILAVKLDPQGQLQEIAWES